jgi:hypothetical protein
MPEAIVLSPRPHPFLPILDGLAGRGDIEAGILIPLSRDLLSCSGIQNMRRTRQVIVVAVVATALCAGRVASIAPQQTPVAQLAGKLIDRLSSRFRRVIPSARICQPVRQEARAVDQFRIAAPEPVFALPVTLSPFHFRLPPPIA